MTVLSAPTRNRDELRNALANTFDDYRFDHPANDDAQAWECIATRQFGDVTVMQSVTATRRGVDVSTARINTPDMYDLTVTDAAGLMSELASAITFVTNLER